MIAVAVAGGAFEGDEVEPAVVEELFDGRLGGENGVDAGAGDVQAQGQRDLGQRPTHAGRLVMQRHDLLQRGPRHHSAHLVQKLVRPCAFR